MAALPTEELTPETTSRRQGFIHPVELTGTAGKAQVRFILRDFDDEELDRLVALLERVAAEIMATEPRGKLEHIDRDLDIHISLHPAAPSRIGKFLRRLGYERVTVIGQPIGQRL